MADTLSMQYTCSANTVWCLEVGHFDFGLSMMTQQVGVTMGRRLL